MARRELRIAVLSDTHVGSDLAIMPEEWKLSEAGRTIQPNLKQIELLKAYHKCLNEFERPDILVVNGDCIEGQSRWSYGTEVWTTNLTDQNTAAINLYERWRARHNFIVRGTSAHTKINGIDQEEQLARTMKADYYSEHHEQQGLRTDYSLYLHFKDYNDFIIEFAHHIATTMVPHYIFTPIGREMYIAKVNTKHRHNSQVLVRGHNHRFAHTASTSHYGFVSPCWQLITPYMRKRSDASVPDIGMLYFYLNKDGFNYKLKTFTVGKPELTHL